MKKLIYKLSFICLFTAAFVSCEEDTVVYDVDGGQSAYLFTSETSNLPVNNEEVTTIKVEVGVTTVSSSDRAIPFTIDPASTALPAEYSLNSPSSVTIPAGEFVGYIEITGNFDAIPENVTKTLIFNITESSDVFILDEKGQHTVSIFRSCPTDLAGSYSVTTNYSVHDFLPDFSSYTMTVDIEAVTGPNVLPNTYKIKDFSGGLYSVGPYAAAYGTGGAGAATLIDLIFNANCGNIVWSNQADPWGAIVQGPNVASTYDNDTGVITISWRAVGYGETGVSVYTPIN